MRKLQGDRLVRTAAELRGIARTITDKGFVAKLNKIATDLEVTALAEEMDPERGDVRPAAN
jgi:hypothetical protein